MNVIMAAADLLFDADAYRNTCAELQRVTAERDAALARVAALEEQLQTARTDTKFYFDMVMADDAWRKAKRQRETL